MLVKVGGEGGGGYGVWGSIPMLPIGKKFGCITQKGPA
jgi:hypothetical protein